MATQFAHLRVHSEYSLVDSIIRLKPLLAECVKRNIPAIALTDMSNMFAAVKFYKLALAAGVKPIFGVDLLVEGEGGECFELTLLAESNKGYQSISELISRAYLDAERYQGVPVIVKSWLREYDFTEVIILSGGIEGELAKALLTGHPNRAKSLVSFYQSLCGEENFFIEIEQLSKAGDFQYIELAKALSHKLKAPLVASNSVRFLNEEDFDDHEVRVGIYQGYTLLDETRKTRFSTKQYLRSADEMSALFKETPEAIENALIIAKRCNVTFKLGDAVLPRFDIPQGLTEAEYFAKVSYDGLNERFAIMLKGKNEAEKTSITQTYEQRLQIEIDVICQMGFPGYFLIVADFIKWSKENHIPVGPGRGSGAGSLVAYALKITDIDPIPYGLLFERFLNPERVSMPDFDIDFCMDGRDRVIDYVARKYGFESVSQIITYGSMAAKAVVRDVGRVLGQPYGFVDKIAKLIPNDLGIKLQDACAKGTPLYDYAKEDEAVESILQSALKLEGLTRSVGKHAAGVVISPSKVTDFSPIYCEEGSKQLVTQFDKKDVEEVGLVKFDFLGLRNLTIIDNALKIVNKTRQRQSQQAIDIALIPMDDKKTFQLLQKGDTTGVFQLESRGMKELIKRLRPDCFEDIIALVALYRPGPLGSGMVDDFVNRKHGRQEVSYPHPDLKEVLKETYGTILYQEQVMQIAQILANYSLGAADLLRRAMGKKIPEEMAKQRETFEQGALENGIDGKLASSIFDLMEEFAKYGFNKSHSAAYALVSYQTAYLKAHYPEAFMAAVLSSDMDNTDKVVNFISECKYLKLSLNLPNINESDYVFTVNDQSEIVYGLGAIKGVGHAAIDLIVEERGKNGAFKDLYDFCLRVDLRKVNKRVCEALIYAGAMDILGMHRAGLIAEIEDAMKSAEQVQKMNNSGQLDFFGFAQNDASEKKIMPKDKQISPWSNKEKLIYEKSVLGMFLSGHIIDEDRFWLNALKTVPLKNVAPTRKKESVLLAGVVVSLTQRKTKSGKLMAVLQIDDSQERMELVIFSELYDRIKEDIKVDSTIIVEGEASIDAYNDQLRVNALKIFTLENYVKEVAKGLEITVDFKEIAPFLSCIKSGLTQKSHAEAESFEYEKGISLAVNSEEYSAKFFARKLDVCIYQLVNKMREITLPNSHIQLLK